MCRSLEASLWARGSFSSRSLVPHPSSDMRASLVALREALHESVHSLAQLPQQPLSVAQLITFGEGALDRSPAMALQSAVFLRRELPVRLIWRKLLRARSSLNVLPAVRLMGFVPGSPSSRASSGLLTCLLSWTPLITTPRRS